MNAIERDWTVHPGETLREALEERDWRGKAKTVSLRTLRSDYQRSER